MTIDQHAVARARAEPLPRPCRTFWTPSANATRCCRPAASMACGAVGCLTHSLVRDIKAIRACVFRC